MIPCVEQVMRQTKQRLFGADTHASHKLVSLFEPSTEIIPKGKAAKPTEFGKLIKIQEAENQIITAYEVFEQRPQDADLLLGAIEVHQQRLGRLPRLVAAGAGFYSPGNETQAQQRGVKRVAIPHRSSRNRERRRHQKKRWFRQAQKWRTGLRSIKESCLDRMILFGERSLRRAVQEFVAHYHFERNHQGLDNQLIFPEKTAAKPNAPIKSRQRLGGLLKYYHRQAA